MDRLKYIFENARVGIAICSAETNTLEAVNPAFAHIHGYEPEELIGVSPGEVFAPECMQRLAEHESGVSGCAMGDVSFETTHIRKDGSSVPVSVHITVIRDESGAIKHRIANIQDISERKEIEQGIKESHERLKEEQNKLMSFLSTIPDVMWMKDVNGVYINCNRAFEEFFNMSSEHIIGKTDYDFFKKEEADICKATDLEAIIARDVCISEEIVYNPEKNTTTILEIRKAPVYGGDGELIGVMGIGRDITEQKTVKEKLEKSEVLFRSIVENLPGFAFVLRLFPNGMESFSYLSGGVSDFFGKEPHELIGDISAFQSMIHKDDIRRFKEAIMESAYSLEPFCVEYRVAHPQKGELWLESMATPEAQEDGSVLWHGITINITNRKLYQLQSELVSMAINSSNEAFYIGKIDEQGLPRYSFTNDKATEMLGYSKEEFVGMSPLNFDPSATEEILCQMAAQKQTSFETTHRRKDGALLPVEVGISVFLRDKEQFVINIVRDITERKRQEDLTYEREQEFRVLVENAPNPISRYDKGGRQTYINPFLLSLVGRTAQDLLGGTAIEKPLMSAKESEKVHLSVKYVLSSGEPTDNEVELVSKNGDTHIFHAFYAPELGRDGNVVGVLLVAHDITGRKLYESILEKHSKTEKRQSQFFEVAPGFFFTMFKYGDDYSMSFASHGIRELLGVESQAVIDNFDLFVTVTHPDDLDTAFCKMEGSAIGLTPYIVEHRINHPQKGIRWVECNSIPQRMENGGIRWDGFMYDITERKEAEEALREREVFLDTLLNAIPSPVFYKDTNGIYLGVNQAYETFFGASPAQLVGKSVFDTHPMELAEIYHAKDVEIFEGGVKTQRYESQLKHANGTLRDILFSKAPFFDEQGRTKGLVGAILDITERKHMEDALRKSESVARHNAAILQAVLESSPNVVTFALDKEYKYLAFNQKHISVINAIWGKKVEMGANMLDNITREDDRQKAKALFDRALAGECFVDEAEYGDEAHSRSYWQTYYAPVCGKEGEIVGLTCFNLDVTEKKLLEKELRHREQYQRTLLDNFPYFVWLKDIEGRFLATNSQMARVAKVASSLEMEGKSDFDFFPYDLAEKYTSDDRAVMESRAIKDVTEMYSDENGELRWMETWKSPLIADGNVVGTVGCSRDITEKMRQQYKIAMLTNLVDRINEAVYLINKEAYFQYVNESACKTLGYTKDELLGGMSVADIDPDYQASRWGEHWSELKDAGSMTIETAHMAKDGRFVLVEVRLNYIEFDGEGYILALAKTKINFE